MDINWQDQLKGQSLPWLLETGTPEVRYLALRDLIGCSSVDPELVAARKTAHTAGPIATVLENMDPAGFWVVPGHGYLPKFRSSVWAISLLAQLGANIHEDERIGQACNYILEYGLTIKGQFTTSGAPSGTADCLQGNLCWALLELGCEDPRLETAFDWMAHSIIPQYKTLYMENYALYLRRFTRNRQIDSLSAACF